MKKNSTGQYAIYLGEKTFRIPSVIKLRKLVLREKLFAGDYVYLYEENRWELACNLPELIDLFPDRHKEALRIKQQAARQQKSERSEFSKAPNPVARENTEYRFGETQSDGFLSEAPIVPEDSTERPRNRHRRMLDDMYNLVQTQEAPVQGSTELDVIGTIEMKSLGKPRKWKMLSQRWRAGFKKKVSETITFGKTARVLTVLLLVALALGAGYWLGAHQYGFLGNVHAIAFNMVP